MSLNDLQFPPGVFSTRDILGDRYTAPVRPRLVLDLDPEADTLTTIDFGRIPFGQGDESRLQLTDDFAFCLDAGGGWPVGFLVDRFSSFTTIGLNKPERIEFLRFDAPLLGLANASADHVALEASTQLAGEPTFARRLWREILSDEQRLFDRRSSAEIEEMLVRILQAGDMTAHLGLGAQRLAVGDLRGALTHLRIYVRLAPASRAGLELLAQAERGTRNADAAAELETLASDLSYEADSRIAHGMLASTEI